MSNLQSVQGSSGRFLNGISGNPGGRPRGRQKVAELARSYTSEDVETLVHLMRHGKEEPVRGTATQALLDRGWSKPKVAFVTDGAGSCFEALRLMNELMGQDKALS